MARAPVQPPEDDDAASAPGDAGMGRNARLDARLDAIERSISDLRAVLARLEPKIEDMSGFIKYGVPHLVRKEELGLIRNELMALRYGIEKRPTRRQAMLDIAWISGLIMSAITFGARLVH